MDKEIIENNLHTINIYLLTMESEIEDVQGAEGLISGIRSISDKVWDIRQELAKGKE